MTEIKYISNAEATRIYATFNPRGLFIVKDGELWIAVDNTTGEAWTEEFRSEQEAVDYLKGKENE